MFNCLVVIVWGGDLGVTKFMLNGIKSWPAIKGAGDWEKLATSCVASYDEQVERLDFQSERSDGIE